MLHNKIVIINDPEYRRTISRRTPHYACHRNKITSPILAVSKRKKKKKKWHRHFSSDAFYPFTMLFAPIPPPALFNVAENLHPAVSQIPRSPLSRLLSSSVFFFPPRVYSRCLALSSRAYVRPRACADRTHSDGARGRNEQPKRTKWTHLASPRINKQQQMAAHVRPFFPSGRFRSAGSRSGKGQLSTPFLSPTSPSPPSKPTNDCGPPAASRAGGC